MVLLYAISLSLHYSYLGQPLYEKLFWLKDRMHTPTARQLAEERHRYMVEFVERFRAEWEGEQ